jgi:voltage-gated potassium channel
MGSQYWPQTGAGRLLAFLLSLYAFGVFGYTTAAIASYFIGTDQENSTTDSIDKLHQKIDYLTAEIQRLSQTSRANPDENL